MLMPGSLGNTRLREERICGGHQKGRAREGSALGGSCRNCWSVGLTPVWRQEAASGTRCDSGKVMKDLHLPHLGCVRIRQGQEGQRAHRTLPSR